MRISKLTCRFLAAALLVGTVGAACSDGDDQDLPTTTKVTVSKEEAARELMCDALSQYASAEERRVRGATEDAGLIQRLESARSKSLDLLVSTLTPGVPANVKDALSQLKGMPIQLGPDKNTPPPAVDTETPLKVVWGALDPLCQTENGQPKSSTTTRATTATSAGGTATTAAGTPTTAAASSTTAAKPATTAAASSTTKG